MLVGTVTEKLMTYALGRGLEYHDMPAVRGDRACARPREDYRFSSLVRGIVSSVPFQMTAGHERSPDGPGSTEGTPMYIYEGIARPSTDVPERRGRRTGAAVARRDGAGLTPGADRARPQLPRRLRLHPARRDHERVDAGDRGAGFEFTPILKPLEPFRDRWSSSAT